jgi:hypothetical protein
MKTLEYHLPCSNRDIYQRFDSHERWNKTYKVVCKVDRLDGRGIIEYPLFLHSKNEKDAELKAKIYCIDFLAIVFYGVASISEI